MAVRKCDHEVRRISDGSVPDTAGNSSHAVTICNLSVTARRGDVGVPPCGDVGVRASFEDLVARLSLPGKLVIRLLGGCRTMDGTVQSAAKRNVREPLVRPEGAVVSSAAARRRSRC